MFLTLTSTAPQATDLGYLLHKHPDRVQPFDLSVGVGARVLPGGDRRAVHGRAAARGRPDRAGARQAVTRATAFALAQYVNDRPYAASSMLAVALGKVFRTAMAGRCDARPELAEPTAAAGGPRPGAAVRAAAPSSSRGCSSRSGWTVEADGRSPLDPTVPGVGRLAATSTLRLTGDAPAGRGAVAPVRAAAGARRRQALLGGRRRGRQAGPRRRAAGCAAHPERELITRRYLAHQRDAGRDAVGRLAEVDDAEPEALDDAVPTTTPRPRSRRCRWSTLRERRLCSPRCARRARAGWSTSAAARARCCATLLAGRRRSPRSSASTCRRARCERGRAPARPRPDARPPARARLRLLQSSLTYRDDAARRLRRGGADGGRRARRPDAAAGPRARPCSATPARARSSSRRRTSSTTSATEPGRRRDAAPATTGSSGPGREFAAWAARRREPLRLRGAVPAGRRRRPRGRAADADGGVHVDDARPRGGRMSRRWRIPELCLVVLVGVVRLGQVDVRRASTSGRTR